MLTGLDGVGVAEVVVDVVLLLEEDEVAKLVELEELEDAE